MRPTASIELNFVVLPLAALLRAAFTQTQNRMAVQDEGHFSIGRKGDLLHGLVVRRGHQHGEWLGCHLDG